MPGGLKINNSAQVDYNEGTQSLSAACPYYIFSVSFEQQREVMSSILRAFATHLTICGTGLLLVNFWSVIHLFTIGNMQSIFSLIL